MGKIILTIITIVIGGSAAGALEHKSISAKDKEFLAGQNVPRVSAPAREKGILDLPVNNSGNTSSHRNTNSAAGINPQAAKDWTVLVYLNGKNDLERGELYSLNSLEMAGSNATMNIVAEAGRMNGQADDVTTDGNWTGSRRYYITRDADWLVVNSQVIQSFDKADMGDWRHLAEFAKWGKKNYPARHYALIIWNHGSGWITTKGLSKGISYDFETNNHISTPELGAAMKEIGKVDILGFDACLMQMAEVAYEVKDYADYVVGSEETVPEASFPYKMFLNSFTHGGSAEELTSVMVSSYGSSYESEGDVTLSTIKVSALAGFMGAFNAWTEALLASDKKPLIKAKYLSAVAYADNDNKDLYDVVRLAAEADPQGLVAEKGRALLAVMKDKLIVSNIAYGRPRITDYNSHGLAIYLPKTGYNPKYDALAWARDTRWDDFLKEMEEVAVACTDPSPNASFRLRSTYEDCLNNVSSFNYKP